MSNTYGEDAISLEEKDLFCQVITEAYEVQISNLKAYDSYIATKWNKGLNKLNNGGLHSVRIMIKIYRMIGTLISTMNM
jgi:hypothetical protein